MLTVLLSWMAAAAPPVPALVEGLRSKAEAPTSTNTAAPSTALSMRLFVPLLGAVPADESPATCAYWRRRFGALPLGGTAASMGEACMR